jgi:hypothetical protein
MRSQAEIEADLKSVGDAFKNCDPLSYETIKFDDGSEFIQNRKQALGDQIYDLYVELGSVLKL